MRILNWYKGWFNYDKFSFFAIQFMILVLVILQILIMIYPPPPDTRSEYQKLNDKCVFDQHDNFLRINALYDECDILLDIYLGNNWTVVSESQSKTGKIYSYMLQRNP